MNKLIFTLVCGWLSLVSAAVNAGGIDKNTAKMQAMDKITGRVSVIYVPVGGMVKFGSFSIVVRACKTRPMEETPDNFAFVDIADKTLKGDDVNVFRGWMISSSPATSAVEHPIYDAWLLACVDRKVDKKDLLTEEQLAAHESIPSADEKMAANDIAGEKVTDGSELIYEMQEDMPHQHTQAAQTMEFSYDEADETEEDEGDSEQDTEIEVLTEEEAPDTDTHTDTAIGVVSVKETPEGEDN